MCINISAVADIQKMVGRYQSLHHNIECFPHLGYIWAPLQQLVKLGRIKNVALHQNGGRGLSSQTK